MSPKQNPHKNDDQKRAKALRAFKEERKKRLQAANMKMKLKLAHAYMLEAIEQDNADYLEKALINDPNIFSKQDFPISLDEKISYLEAAVINKSFNVSERIINSFKEKGPLSPKEKNSCVKAIKALETLNYATLWGRETAVKQIHALYGLNYGEQLPFAVHKYRILTTHIAHDILQKHHTRD